MSPRDTQRQRVYTAESVLQGGQQIANADLQDWVDAVMRRKAIRSRWGDRHITVELGRGGGRAYLSRINLGTWARNPRYMLHEIAHCLVMYDSNEYADHGPEFAGVLLFLVRTVMGDGEAKTLLASYRKHRVRHNTKAIPDPKPVPTLEEKARERRERETRPVSWMKLQEAAEVIRRAAKAGQLGPADRKPRQHALDTARLLDTAAGGRKPTGRLTVGQRRRLG